MRVIIHAPSTHIGGGKSLLSAVLQALSEEQGEWSEAFAILDRRLAPELGEVTGGLTIAYADAGFTGRLRAQLATHCRSASLYKKAAGSCGEETKK